MHGLAFYTNPEAAWLANPVALAACLADAAAASAGSPIDSLFWCAGTWGCWRMHRRSKCWQPSNGQQRPKWRHRCGLRRPSCCA